jgi:hypothetical protein
MIGLLCFGSAILISPFKSKMRLEAENAVLRHQLIVLRRNLCSRVQLANSDRWFFIQLYHWFPSILQVLTIIRPETLIRSASAGHKNQTPKKSSTRWGGPTPAVWVRCSASQPFPIWLAFGQHLLDVFALGTFEGQQIGDRRSVFDTG